MAQPAFTAETPQAGGVPNFTGRSQGTGPDRSFEALFSGLTETVKNVTNIKDESTQLQIYDEANEMFQQTNQEFGVEAPPPGMQEGAERMANLQAAFEQGKLSETNYYGRLATMTKQLRTKYPGYEKIVDSTIQSVTGTRPANAYRDALFSEIQSLREGASDEVKFRRQYEKENEGEIAAVFGDDYFTNPGAYDFQQVRSKVSAFKGQKEMIDAEANELELMSKRGEFNDKRALRAVDRDFTFLTESILTKSLKLNSTGAETTLNDFIARGGGSAQETELFINQVSELEATTRQSLLARGKERYVSKGLMSNDDLNKAVDSAMYPITKAKEAVLGGDFTLAKKYATLNKQATDQQVHQMLNADPRFKAGKGLEEINRTLGEEFFNQHSGELSDIAVEIAGQTAAGRQNAIKDAVDTGNDKVVRKTLETSLDVLKNPKATPDQISNIVDQFFGPSAVKWMDPKIVAPEDRERLYMTFLNPEVSKAIFSKGSAEDKQKYAEWAITQAPSLKTFRAAAGDMSTLGLKGDWIKYDDKTNRIQMTRQDAFAKNLPEGKRYQQAVQSFNRLLTVLEPIAEGTGVDKKEFFLSVVNSMGIEIDGTPPETAPENKTFFGWVYDALSRSDEEEDVNIKGEKVKKTSSLDEGMKPLQLASLGTEDSLANMPTDFSDVEFGDEDEDYDVLDEDEDPVEVQAERRSKGGGFADLVSSTKRGYQPDLKNLKPELRTGLSELQSLWGRELPIVSGYRDPARNRRAGGARKSQHMHGNAVDIDVSNLSREERIELIRLARKQGWGGIGVYANSLHLDKGSRRAWGPSYRSTSIPKWARDALG